MVISIKLVLHTLLCGNRRNTLKGFENLVDTHGTWDQETLGDVLQGCHSLFPTSISVPVPFCAVKWTDIKSHSNVYRKWNHSGLGMERDLLYQCWYPEVWFLHRVGSELYTKALCPCSGLNDILFFWNRAWSHLWNVDIGQVLQKEENLDANGTVSLGQWKSKCRI